MKPIEQSSEVYETTKVLPQPKKGKGTVTVQNRELEDAPHRRLGGIAIFFLASLQSGFSECAL
jgi:hypothetical protein